MSELLTTTDTSVDHSSFNLEWAKRGVLVRGYDEKYLYMLKYCFDETFAIIGRASAQPHFGGFAPNFGSPKAYGFIELCDLEDFSYIPKEQRFVIEDFEYIAPPQGVLK